MSITYRTYSTRRYICVLAAMLLGATAGAHEGHDDGPKPLVTTSAAPSIEAHSDLFELAGTVEHGALTLYVDRYADNAPVPNARIEIEAGKEQGVAVANPDGSYTFKSAQFDHPAQISLTFTITAGQDSDLLAGDLVLPAASSAHADAPSSSAAPALFAPLPLALSITLAGMVAAFVRFASRRRRASTQGTQS